MLPAKRKRTIVELVSESDGRSVSALAETLDVSKATIRRDLSDLEAEGLIDRSHGGAVPATTVGRERTYGQKEVQRLDAKRAIAERAIEEIREDEVVFFDAGTTTMEVAKRAPADGSFMGVTNSPRLAIELNEGDAEAMLTGGTLRQRTHALVGPSAEEFLDRTNFDLLFLGTNAIDADAGLTTPDEKEAKMKALMVSKAERVVLVADATKCDKRSFVEFAALSDVDRFVTDESPPDAVGEAFDRADETDVVVAS